MPMKNRSDPLRNRPNNFTVHRRRKRLGGWEEGAGIVRSGDLREGGESGRGRRVGEGRDGSGKRGTEGGGRGTQGGER